MEDNNKSLRAMNRFTVTAGFCVMLFVTGCLQTGLNSAAVSEAPQPMAMPLNRPADNYEWVKRLKISDPIEGLPQMNRGAAQATYPIPVPMTAGSRFALVVDHQMQLAWLQSSEGKLGPWPLNQPDVTHLLKSVAIPPTNSAPVQ